MTGAPRLRRLKRIRVGYGSGPDSVHSFGGDCAVDGAGGAAPVAVGTASAHGAEGCRHEGGIALF